MTRPDRAAIIAATPYAAATAVTGTAAWICRSPWLWLFAAAGVAFTGTVLVLFWHVPHDDVTAVADATREPVYVYVPSYVPDAWRKEFLG